jgi:hypothetical protein
VNIDGQDKAKSLPPVHQLKTKISIGDLPNILPLESIKWKANSMK